MSLTKTKLKDIQSLLTKKGRKQEKKFVAEGVRLLEEALRHHVAPETIYYSEAAMSERGQFVVNAFRAQKVAVEPVPLKQLESLGDTDTTQGIVAVFDQPSTDLAELYRPHFRRLLLCENISDPGNLGTLIRSALAFEFDIVILTGTSADPYSPKVVRSSAGTIFGMPVASVQTEELLAGARKHRFSILAADIAGEGAAQQLKRLPKDRPLLLAIGSESHGLSREVLSAALARVKIEHSEVVESLNAAVAGSILMKDIHHFAK